MRWKACLTFLLVVTATILSSAQSLRFPRDPDALLDRAQKFWMAITTSQRSRAMEYVLPEKRDLFLSGAAMPVLRAKVLGVDVTGNPQEAAVRVSLDVVAKESSSGALTWTLTDPWIWKNGNWYLNLKEAPAIFPRTSEAPNIDVKKIQAQIEKFEILQNPLDLGRMIDAQHISIEVPIKYTGDLPLTLEMTLQNPLVALEGLPEPITSSTKSFTLLVSTDDWKGPFRLPLSLEIRHETVTVKRTLVVQGNVFAPLEFRQSPEEGPLPDREFSVFIRNNTDQATPIHSILVDGKMDFVRGPQTLLPHDEVEVVFKPHRNEIPDLLRLILDTPLEGRSTYTYRFPNARH